MMENNARAQWAYAVIPSPLGDLLAASDDDGVTMLVLPGQRNYEAFVQTLPDSAPLAVLRAWLDAYFSGVEPDFSVPLSLAGTPFRMRVWAALKQIPYGTVVTYGELAQKLMRETGARVAARAVGNAVGHNPVSIVVPCHRVVGANGALTGYNGGLDKKARLLEIERVHMNRFNRLPV